MNNRGEIKWNTHGGFSFNRLNTWMQGRGRVRKAWGLLSVLKQTDGKSKGKQESVRTVGLTRKVGP